MSTKTTRTIEVFRTGTFTPMSGAAITFSADDLKAIASSYDGAAHPAPIVVGHPTTDAPAYGWATSFSYDETNDRLTAEIGDIEPAFSDAVGAGRYKKISLSLFSPDASNNPKPGKWYPKHIGFLGAAAPAVSGLKPVAFAGDAGVVTFEFADASAFRDVAALFRALREWIIGKDGTDAADKVLSNWTIGWIEDAASREPSKIIEGPFFSSPTLKPSEKFMVVETTKNDEAAFAAREAALELREKALNAADNVAFAEKLISEGRLLAVSKEKVVGLLNRLSPTGSFQLEVSFSEGDGTKTSNALDLVKSILGSQPPVVSFGAVDLGEEPQELSFANVGDVAARAAGYVHEQAAKGVVITIADAIDFLNRGIAK